MHEAALLVQTTDRRPVEEWHSARKWLHLAETRWDRPSMLYSRPRPRLRMLSQRASAQVQAKGGRNCWTWTQEDKVSE